MCRSNTTTYIMIAQNAAKQLARLNAEKMSRAAERCETYEELAFQHL